MIAHLPSQDVSCLNVTVRPHGDDFTAHAKLADYASEYLTEELGENGVAARAAIGMGTLPGVAPVEVQLVCGVV